MTRLGGGGIPLLSQLWRSHFDAYASQFASVAAKLCFESNSLTSRAWAKDHFDGHVGQDFASKSSIADLDEAQVGGIGDLQEESAELANRFDEVDRRDQRVLWEMAGEDCELGRE